MCGRFAFFAPIDAIREGLAVEREFSVTPRYNIAPTQDVAALRLGKSGRRLDPVHWGLIPRWAEERSIGNRMINARSETVAEKPAFRQAFSRRRCVIPASGFYEWVKAEDGKQPYYIHDPDDPLLRFAGLWERWLDEDTGESLDSCTIITTAANASVSELHHRMPAILSREGVDRWLDPEAEKEELQGLIATDERVRLEHHPVSKRVNSPANDDEALLVPDPEDAGP